MFKLKALPGTNRSLLSAKQSLAGLRRGVRNALFEMGRTHVQETRRIITEGPKTGRLYNIRGRIHQASAPGEAPANLSGILQKSVSYKVRGASEMEFGDTTDYGAYLEEGTRRMKPRPHLKKVVRSQRTNILRTLNRHVEQEIKRRETS